MRLTFRTKIIYAITFTSICVPLLRGQVPGTPNRPADFEANWSLIQNAVKNSAFANDADRPYRDFSPVVSKQRISDLIDSAKGGQVLKIPVFGVAPGQNAIGAVNAQQIWRATRDKNGGHLLKPGSDSKTWRPLFICFSDLDCVIAIPDGHHRLATYLWEWYQGQLGDPQFDANIQAAFKIDPNYRFDYTDYSRVEDNLLELYRKGEVLPDSELRLYLDLNKMSLSDISIDALKEATHGKYQNFVSYYKATIAQSVFHLQDDPLRTFAAAVKFLTKFNSDYQRAFTEFFEADYIRSLISSNENGFRDSIEKIINEGSKTNPAVQQFFSKNGISPGTFTITDTSGQIIESRLGVLALDDNMIAEKVLPLLLDKEYYIHLLFDFPRSSMDTLKGNFDLVQNYMTIYSLKLSNQAASAFSNVEAAVKGLDPSQLKKLLQEASQCSK